MREPQASSLSPGIQQQLLSPYWFVNAWKNIFFLVYSIHSSSSEAIVEKRIKRVGHVKKFFKKIRKAFSSWWQNAMNQTSTLRNWSFIICHLCFSRETTHFMYYNEIFTLIFFTFCCHLSINLLEYFRNVFMMCVDKTISHNILCSKIYKFTGHVVFLYSKAWYTMYLWLILTIVKI